MIFDIMDQVQELLIDIKTGTSEAWDRVNAPHPEAYQLIDRTIMACTGHGGVEVRILAVIDDDSEDIVVFHSAEVFELPSLGSLEIPKNETITKAIECLEYLMKEENVHYLDSKEHGDIDIEALVVELRKEALKR